MKILVDAYLALNLGDDLFLKILFDRYKEVDWVIATDDRRYLEVFKNYKNVKIEKKFFHKLIKKLKLNSIVENQFYYDQYDAYICIGGSMYIENEGWKYLYDYRMKIAKIFNKNDKPIFLLGSNFGPYKSTEFYDCYKEYFRVCKDVCFRENYSYNLFKEINSVRVAPDIVFQIDKNKYSKRVERNIGISLINLIDREELEEFSEQYLENIIKIIKFYVEKKYKITLFSFCNEQGDNTLINNIINTIEGVEEAYINIVEYEGNIDEFLNIYSNMEFIIGVRFHSVILSQVFSQGVYPIIYSEKTYNVLKDIGLSNSYIRVQDIDKLDIESLDYSVKKNTIDIRLIKKESERQFEKLDKYIHKQK